MFIHNKDPFKLFSDYCSQELVQHRFVCLIHFLENWFVSYKDPRYPMTSTLYDSHSLHGDFNPFETVLIAKILYLSLLAVDVASIYRSTGPEIEHCKTFVFINSGKNTKVLFFSKN